MLAPSDKDIRVTMIKMLKELVEKVDSIHEQMEFQQRWKLHKRVKWKCEK